MGKPVKSLDELKKLSREINFECYILLNGGLKSSKTITYNSDGSWFILHGIDDYDEEFENDDELKEKYPILFEAIEKNALISY